MPKFQQFVLLVISFVSLFLFAGCQSSANVANTANTEVKSISYENFTANTTFADIIKVYGNPDSEKTFPHEQVVLPMKLACYGNQNWCFVLVNLKHVHEPNNNAFYSYVGTIKINPSEVIHYVQSSEGGDTRPLLEFFRGQIAESWAKASKDARHK